MRLSPILASLCVNNLRSASAEAQQQQQQREDVVRTCLAQGPKPLTVFLTVELAIICDLQSSQDCPGSPVAMRTACELPLELDPEHALTQISNYLPGHT